MLLVVGVDLVGRPIHLSKSYSIFIMCQFTVGSQRMCTIWVVASSRFLCLDGQDHVLLETFSHTNCVSDFKSWMAAVGNGIEKKIIWVLGTLKLCENDVLEHHQSKVSIFIFIFREQQIVMLLAMSTNII